MKEETEKRFCSYCGGRMLTWLRGAEENMMYYGDCSTIPFDDAFNKETYILSSRKIVEKLDRKKVGDTDIGNDLKKQIKDLKLLLRAYRKGIINEIM